MSKTLHPGDPAPDFTLIGLDGSPFRLSDHFGHQPVVIFFYPKDETLVCTREACAFRDSHKEFREAGALVVGISDDSPESHRDFASHHHLPYLLLSDPRGMAAELYGVPRFLFLKGRMTFVIDREGIIRLAYGAMTQSDEHVLRALEAVRSLGETVRSGG